MTAQDARRAAADELGITDFDGSASAFQLLSEADKERVSTGSIRYILANPARFSAETISVARTLAAKKGFGSGGDYAPPDALDNATEFVKAYGETAGEFVVGASGVVGDSAKKLGINLGAVAAFAVVAAVLWFGAPYVLPKLKAALSKRKTP